MYTKVLKQLQYLLMRANILDLDCNIYKIMYLKSTKFHLPHTVVLTFSNCETKSII